MTIIRHDPRPYPEVVITVRPYGDRYLATATQGIGKLDTAAVATSSEQAAEKLAAVTGLDKRGRQG